MFINGDELEDLPERLEPYFTCSSGAEALPDGLAEAESPDLVQRELLQQILAQSSSQGEILQQRLGSLDQIEARLSNLLRGRC